MQPVAVDTETHPIERDTPFPDLVSAGVTTGDRDYLVLKDEGAALQRALLEDEDALTVMHNAPFDLNVFMRHDPSLMAPIFAALEAGRVSDTGTREKLLAIEDGSFERKTQQRKFNLAVMAKRYLDVDRAEQKKMSPEQVRFRYREVDNVPVEQWPREFIQYAQDDPRDTLRVWWAQEKSMQQGYRPPDEVLQVRADFCLGMMKNSPVSIDFDWLNRYEAKVLKRCLKTQKVLADGGFLHGKDGDVRNTKKLQAAVAEAYAARGLKAPRTDPSGRFPISDENPEGGQIKLDAETLDEVSEPGTPLGVYAEYAHDRSKILGTYLWPIRDAYEQTTGRITFGWRPLMETGRTSCGKIKFYDPFLGQKVEYSINAQNPPREPGVRECFVPNKRDHSDRRNVFIRIDVDIAELKSLAQICFKWFGFSKLRDAFINGLDPHVILAAGLLGISVEDGHAKKEADDPDLLFMRNSVAKHMNFGLAGGMGPPKFCEWVRGATGVGENQLRLDVNNPVIFKGRKIPSAKYLKNHWRSTWTELNPYFRLIGQITGDSGLKKIVQVISGRVRKVQKYTQAANGYFQGHVADMMKDIMWRLYRACYVVEHSPLYGCEPKLFLHDEFIIESAEEQAHDAAMEVERIFHDVQTQWMPDVPPGAQAEVVRVWSKKSKRLVDRHGRLVPWDLTEEQRMEMAA